jgi:hemoglobin/transferrin/lactoferrin receptor protein
MRKLLLLLIALVMSAGAIAQIITVKDKETGLPLDLVTIASEEPKAFAVTNPRGQARIDGFDGSDDIEIRLMGYKTTMLSYSEIKDSGFVIELIPSQISLNQVVISATRWSQPKRDIPAKITSIVVL